MSKLIVEAKMIAMSFESAANIRARFMSRQSENMSRNFENIETDKLENDTIRSSNENQNHQEETIKINLTNHSEYRENDSENSISMRVNNLIEFKKAMNHETNESR